MHTPPARGEPPQALGPMCMRAPLAASIVPVSRVWEESQDSREFKCFSWALRPSIGAHGAAGHAHPQSRMPEQPSRRGGFSSPPGTWEAAPFEVRT
jgi:hypothetical protein